MTAAGEPATATFSPAPRVLAGTAYAIVFSTAGAGQWWISTGVQYAGGELRYRTSPTSAWAGTTDDAAFETLVEPLNDRLPVTTATLSPASANGWWRGPVGLTVSATDLADAGVTGTRCWIDPPARPLTAAAAGSVACPAALTGDAFLILPHAEVAEFYRRRAADTDRWLGGMNKLQRGFEAA